MLEWLWNHGFKIVATAVGILAVTYMLPSVICLLSGPAIGPAAVTQVKIHDDQMIIQGNINADLAAQVHELLNAPHNRISVVRVASIGGEKEPAIQILRDLVTLGSPTIEVPSDFTCQSACIVLALNPAARFEPADDATLLFHRSYIRVGPDTCIFCRISHWEVNYVKDIVQGSSSHREMYNWAESIAPGLGTALAGCDPDPFDTIPGRQITGAEFKAFRNGQLHAVTCPAKPNG